METSGKDVGSKPRLTSTSPVSKSGHLELPTATRKKPEIRATEAVQDVNSALLRQSQPVLAAHPNDPNSLFVTTEKKRMRVDDLAA